jgi:hypothetical protein
MRPYKAVIALPVAGQLHAVFHALKHAPDEVALVLPDAAPDLAAIAGLDQVLTWAREHGKDITLIGGSIQARAEAVLRGLRVATSVAAWEAWLADERSAGTALEQRLLAHGQETGWRVIHPTKHPTADQDEPPAYLATLRPADEAAAPAEAIPADERYEDAVTALIWQTGKLGGMPDD